MGEREEEVQVGADVRDWKETTKRDWQTVRRHLLTLGHHLRQIRPAPNVHGLEWVAEDLSKWVKTEQNASDIIVLKRINLDQLQWLNGITISWIKQNNLG